MRVTIAVAIIFLSAGTLFAQDKTTADFPKNRETIKYIERIPGTWKLLRIVDEEKNNKATANSKKNKSGDKENSPTTDIDASRNAMQMLEFNPDARYKVNNSTTAIDSGSYRINEQQGILYMESDADDISPTEWTVTVNKNQLTLVGRDPNADSRYKYIYSKEQEKLGKK
jgi:hypothetical protein